MILCTQSISRLQLDCCNCEYCESCDSVETLKGVLLTSWKNGDSRASCLIFKRTVLVLLVLLELGRCGCVLDGSDMRVWEVTFTRRTAGGSWSSPGSNWGCGGKCNSRGRTSWSCAIFAAFKASLSRYLGRWQCFMSRELRFISYVRGYSNPSLLAYLRAFRDFDHGLHLLGILLLFTEKVMRRSWNRESTVSRAKDGVKKSKLEGESRNVEKLEVGHGYDLEEKCVDGLGKNY